MNERMTIYRPITCLSEPHNSYDLNTTVHICKKSLRRSLHKAITTRKQNCCLSQKIHQNPVS